MLKDGNVEQMQSRKARGRGGMKGESNENVSGGRREGDESRRVVEGEGR